MAEQILASVLLLVCLIDSVHLLFGIAFETDSPVNLEVPAIGLTLKLEGRFIGHVLPGGEGKEKHFPIDLSGILGSQTVEECKDEGGVGKKHTLKLKAGMGAAEPASITTENSALLFLEEVQFMDK